MKNCCDKWKYLAIARHQYDIDETFNMVLTKVQVVNSGEWDNIITYCPQCGKKLEMYWQPEKNKIGGTND